PERLRRALYDLEDLGIASNDTALSAFVHAGVERSSQRRLAQSAALESALIAAMREAAPELEKGQATVLHLRLAAQSLKDAGHAQALPERLWRLLGGLAADGRDEALGAGSLRTRRLDAESVEVTLQRSWSALEETARRRRAAAGVVLAHLLGCLPHGARGLDQLAQTTLGALLAAIKSDLVLAAQSRQPARLLDRALLWLHEQEVMRLNKGLAVFRPAMSIRLAPGRRGFSRGDFAALRLHYDEQVVQIHVMAEYVRRGLAAMAEALALAMDDFSLGREAFIARWLPEREKELARQTTPASWRAIVESLRNPAQQRIVTDERERNVLVLAGPGAGKTRVLAHRIAYLLRVRRENPRGILALAYNRHAAVEIRRRLQELVADEAKAVTVLTCHALAMRLAGVSFARRAQAADEEAFRAVMREAVALLEGKGLPPDEADEQRERLLAGFGWILVDEYQDIGPEQYALVSALAGRTRREEERKIGLFAVGDDDQNLYAFAGASVEYIRRFEADYAAGPAYLTENYRSSAHIIEAANRVIEPARERMKAGHPIAIDRARAKQPPGGQWRRRDPVGQGRVQVLPAGGDARTQALAVMTELRRLASLDGNWCWSGAAVIAREWKLLEPVRAYCESEAIPVQVAGDEPPQFWRLRETQALVEWLHSPDSARDSRAQPAPAGKQARPAARAAPVSAGGALAGAGSIAAWIAAQPQGPWWSLLGEAVTQYALETGGAELPAAHFVEWLAEWGREVRRRQTGLLLLTAHRAKGLEFEHVAVLDGGWERAGRDEDADAPRRLYYVAMTRARSTLTLARLSAGNALLDGLPESPAILRRAAVALPGPGPELARRYRLLTLADIDLGYAGRQARGHAVHHAIAGLAAGAALELRREAQHWVLHDARGRRVGRLSRSFSPPKGLSCIQARVAASVVRRREDAQAGYARLARCERWEVVVPELVYG
ncbi:MAG: ATP-dependent helicase, partial [Burkholderiales bacterium]|nr:ATP-dependent helicase [Burkholderiales bacterium]